MKTLAFGEILWDVLPDSRHLGGAPLNVSGHLARLGAEAHIVSSLGDDDYGREAMAILKAENIGTKYVSVHPDIPTGFTRITLEDGIPSYEFNMPCAWDRILLSPGDLSGILAAEWDVFCFGSLAQRSAESRETLDSLLDGIRAKIVFFDVNLRKNFYSAEIIARSVSRCDVVKMNEDEWPVLRDLLSPLKGADEAAFCEWLIREYKLRGALVTKGKRGVTAYFGGEAHSRLPSDVPVVDTVGAGDSFSAAFLVAILKGLPVPEALRLATELADYVVSHSGAMPEYDGAIRARLRALM